MNVFSACFQLPGAHGVLWPLGVMHQLPGLMLFRYLLNVPAVPAVPAVCVCVCVCVSVCVCVCRVRAVHLQTDTQAFLQTT